MKKVWFYLLVFTGIAVTGTSQVRYDRYMPPPGQPRNIVIISANGLGMGHISLLQQNSSGPLTLGTYDAMGFAQPKSMDKLIIDSRAAATAIASGTLTYNGYGGRDEKTNPVKNLAEMVKDKGMAVGLVTTTSPISDVASSFFLHPGRETNKDSLARWFYNLQPQFVLGGGAGFFGDPKGYNTLLQQFVKNGYEVESKMKKVGKLRNPKTIALVSKEDIGAANTREDYLPKGSTNAMQALSSNRQGYLLLIENPYIARLSEVQGNDVLLQELKDLDATIKAVLNQARIDGQTLVLVTGLYDMGAPVITQKNEKSLETQWSSKQATGNLVPIFAYGPGAEQFSGIYDYTQLHKRLLPYIQARP